MRIPQEPSCHWSFHAHAGGTSSKGIVFHDPLLAPRVRGRSGGTVSVNGLQTGLWSVEDIVPLFPTEQSSRDHHFELVAPAWNRSTVTGMPEDAPKFPIAA